MTTDQARKDLAAQAYEARKAKAREWARQHRLSNRDALNAAKKIYVEKNREIVAERKRRWYYANRERIAAKEKARAARCDSKAKRREYLNNKYVSDPQYRMAVLCRGRIYRAMRNQSARKERGTRELLGCSIQFLREYIEAKFAPGMSWENQGKAWHLDHIIPCSLFDLQDREKVNQCFHYSNLQPMFSRDNLRKRNKCPGPHQAQLI